MFFPPEATITSDSASFLPCSPVEYRPLAISNSSGVGVATDHVTFVVA